MFAGARGFHRCVQRQDIGLEGDAVDDAGDLRDLFRRHVDFLHGVRDLAHHRAALLGGGSGLCRELADMLAAMIIFLEGGAELFHAGGCLFQAGRLRFGACTHVARALGDFARGIGDRLAVLADAEYNMREITLHMPHRLA